MASPPRSSPVVPEALRDLVRKRKERESESQMEEISRSSEEASSKKKFSEEDEKSLKDLIEDSKEGYAKGGMVQKKGGRRGDGICSKGYTKGKMY
jgi:hypothetical protein